MITLAVDVMGGDNAPEAIIAGAAEASQLHDIKLILVGDAAQIKRHLKQHAHDHQRIELHHAPSFVAMDAKPQEALEQHPEASILVATRLVAEGLADALVSAGNTGACILAAARNLPRIEGVRRTALAAVYPTERRHGPHGDPFALMLDVGSTLEASARDLVHFAIMGSAYAKVISRNPRPKVALLSNGEESNKGTPEIIEAHAILRQMPELNFIGNVEGVDIPRGTADVIVCNGFIGNVTLKMLEGISEVVKDMAQYAMEHSLLWKLGLLLLSRGINRIHELTDWQGYGGAPMLGFHHVVIKAHGRSGQRAVRNAIKVAAKAVRGGLCQAIRQEVALIPAPHQASGIAAQATAEKPAGAAASKDSGDGGEDREGTRDPSRSR